jgi:putative acetyltransferase
MHAGPVTIRAERGGDEAAIAAVIGRAFADHPHSDQSEARIVAALRAAGALAVALVAQAGHAVVGHVAASAVRVDDGTPGWFGLGPVAVEPAYQRQGVGTSLVAGTLLRLRALGAAGCVVVGDPAYYRRFGFGAPRGLVLPDVPPGYFMALSFAGAWPAGTVAYHAAFAAGA